MRTRWYYILVSFWIFSTAVVAQTDIQGTRAVQAVFNLTYGTAFQDRDSTDVLSLPSGSVITGLYWRADTSTVAVDSLQLRLGSSLVRVGAWTPDIEGKQGAVQVFRPDLPVEADEVLRARLFATPDAAGQIRLTIEWIPIF